MGKLENVYPYTDLLSYAERNNICSWNEAIELMEQDGFIPFYENASREIYPTDGEELSSENEKLRYIIDGFCKEQNIPFVTIVDS